VLGTLYSLNGKVLKLSAQLLPVGEADPAQVRLQVRGPDGAEPTGPPPRWGPGSRPSSA
jgi:hypothetical protein